MSAELIRQVWSRARNRCEYCHYPAAAGPLRFHIDHIIARQHGGATDLANLALSCLHCNRHKGPNVAGIHPGTGQLTPLFNPRTDDGPTHFRWNGDELVGSTAVGETTIRVLAINDPEFRAARALLMAEGAFQRA